jgi:two-component system, cell cycle sensor histidine kinase and response regulator CckA
MTSISEREALRIRSLRDFAILDTEPELAFDELTQLAAIFCEVPIALITLVDKSRQWFKSRVGVDISETPRDISFCARAIEDTKDLFEISDTFLDPRFSDNPYVTNPPHVRFYAGVPLITRDGFALGTLCVMAFEPRTLTPHQSRALKVLANQVMALMELRRLSGRQPTGDGRAEARFREAEEMYRTLIEQVPAVAYIADYGDAGKWHYISPRIESMLGYRAQEWTQNPHLWLDSIHPDDRERVLTEGAVLWRSKTEEPLKQQYRMIARDGRVVWVSDEAVIVRDEKGDPAYYRGVLIDITDTKEAEAAHEKLEEQLRQSQKMDAVGRLAGGVAHDFNNLLSVILSYSRFLLEDLDPTDSRRPDVEEIQRAGERAASLVHQLLTFSRKEIVSPTVLDLNAVVRDMERFLRRTIGEHISLVTKLGPDLWPIKADRGQMEQVLANLTVNARDAIADGGTVTITTRNLTETDIPGGSGNHKFVCLEVQDTGTGMSADTLASAFEPFFTTKGRGEGTGLGLATVYGIVQQAGGHVSAISSPGSGATFSVVFPVTDEIDDLATGGDDEVTQSGHGQTILVVEDEDGVRKVVERVLGRKGYKVLVAGSGSEALTLAEAHDGTIDVLLTDIVMPQMSGKELARRLSFKRPDMRIVFMSGYTDEIASRANGLDQLENFIPKPFTVEELLDRIRSHADRT